MRIYHFNVEKSVVTMCNRNYGGFDQVQSHLELQASVPNQKTLTLIS